MDISDIFKKIKFGDSISLDEKETILYKLSKPKSNIELEDTIKAFGLVYPPTEKNIQLIEGYLNSNSDIVLSSVIKVLCHYSYWGLASNYLNQLKAFIRKEDAYRLSNTQITVFFILGKYINKTKDSHILNFLLLLFNRELDEYLSDYDEFYGLRLEKIYHSIDVGVRGRKAEIEYRVDSMKIPEDINEIVIKEAESIIKRYKISDNKT